MAQPKLGQPRGGPSYEEIQQRIAQGYRPPQKPKPKMGYIPALKLWNGSKGYVKGSGNWCVPTKGSTDHKQLMDIMHSGKAPKKRILLATPVATQPGPVPMAHSAFGRARDDASSGDDDWVDDGAPIPSRFGDFGAGGRVSAANARRGDVFDQYEAQMHNKDSIQRQTIKKYQQGARRKRGLVEVGNRTMRGNVRTKKGVQLPTRKIGYRYDDIHKGERWNTALVRPVRMGPNTIQKAMDAQPPRKPMKRRRLARPSDIARSTFPRARAK